MQRFKDASMQQGIESARGSATGAIETGGVIKQALGIDGVVGRIDREDKSRRARARAYGRDDLRAGGAFPA